MSWCELLITLVYGEAKVISSKAKVGPSSLTLIGLIDELGAIDVPPLLNTSGNLRAIIKG